MLIKYIFNHIKSLFISDEIKSVYVQKKVPEHIQIASQFLDYDERKHNHQLKKLMNLDPAKIPWCAAFVNAIEKKSGRPGTQKLNARSYLHYGINTKTPKHGDIVIFKRGNSSWKGHVGYFIKQEGDKIITLGGNQNNKVCMKAYPERKVLGYRAID